MCLSLSEPCQQPASIHMNGFVQYHEKSNSILYHEYSNEMFK